jgi:hypothetical protein
MPTPAMAPSPDTTVMSGDFLRSPTYLSNRNPFLMFLPTVYPWYGPIFKRLSYTFASLPIVQLDSNLWGLQPCIMEEWTALEHNLRTVRRAMMVYNPQFKTPHYNSYGPPYRFGYQKGYRTEKAARTVVNRAKNGFLILMAELSFWFWSMEGRRLFCEAHESQKRQEWFQKWDWRKDICETASIHPAWFTELELSVVGDLSVPRRGTILDFTDPHAVPGNTHHTIPRAYDVDSLLSYIILSDVPVPLYINWGKGGWSPPLLPTGIQSLEFHPGWQEISYLRSLPGRVAFSPWAWTLSEKKRYNLTKGPVLTSCRDSHPYVAAPSATADLDPAEDALPSTALSSATLPSHPGPAFSSAAAAAPFPPVERGSGQREGETMEAFFARRQESNVRRGERESVDDRRLREGRESIAAKGNAPGNKGARVYIWEDEDGHYIRRAAGRKYYADFWEEYGPDQRRYDSFHDEWDLCDAFGPDADGDGDEDQSYLLPLQDEEDDVFQEMLPETEPQISVEDGEIYSSEADLKRIHGTSVSSPDIIDIVPIASTFKEMVLLRFGCTVVEDGNLFAHEDLPVPTAIVAKKLLGNAEIVIKHESDMDSFLIFLAHCKKSQFLLNIPPALLDCHQSHSDLYSPWAVEVSRSVLNGQMYYIISGIKAWSDLFILTASASTALEVVRQGWGPSLRDVATNLVSRGIAFMTCFRTNHTTLPPPSSRLAYSGLGYRPVGYKFDLMDYQSYVSRRRAFLRSPRGRAALLYGGVVGRIARSEISAEDVVSGPTDDAVLDGIRLWDGHSSFAYWDDCLTSQEIDLICGVYHVATGESIWSLVSTGRPHIPFRSS